MTLVIRGGTLDNSHTLRRIEEERIQPITVPLSQEIVDCLAGISPEDARLPLALALVDRLHRLWTVAASGLYLNPRPITDEHVYQVMRKSLFNLCPVDEDNLLSAHAVEADLPAGLLPSGRLATLSDLDRTKQVKGFQYIEQTLIVEAIDLGINPDVRTVERALAPFDNRLGRIFMAHDQTMLKQADQLGLSLLMREDLRRSIRSHSQRLYNGSSHYLAMCLEALERIQEIWTLLYADVHSLRRFGKDEPVYQSYREVLLRGLRADPDYKPMLDLALESIPHLLPLKPELTPRNPQFKEMPVRFERLKNEIIAGAMALGEETTIDYPHEMDLDATFEELDWGWTALKVAVRDARKVAADDAAKSPAARQGGRPGRPATRASYDIARDAWWDLSDESAPVVPTRAALAYELEQRGYPVGVRTLRRYIAKWQREGRPFPGPRPEEEAA